MAPGRKTRVEVPCVANPDCPRAAQSRGMCANHYTIWYQAGGKEVTYRHAKKHEDLLTRLEARTVINPGTGCWDLQMALSPVHVSLRWNGKRTAAHRLAYELLVGPVPEDFDVDHMCERGQCWKPLHLEPVTHRVNILRGPNHPARKHLMTTACVCWERRASECPEHGQLHWRDDWRDCIADLEA